MMKNFKRILVQLLMITFNILTFDVVNNKEINRMSNLNEPLHTEYKGEHFDSLKFSKKETSINNRFKEHIKMPKKITSKLNYDLAYHKDTVLNPLSSLNEFGVLKTFISSKVETEMFFVFIPIQWSKAIKLHKTNIYNPFYYYFYASLYEKFTPGLSQCKKKGIKNNKHYSLKLDSFLDSITLINKCNLILKYLGGYFYHLNTQEIYLDNIPFPDKEIESLLNTKLIFTQSNNENLIKLQNNEINTLRNLLIVISISKYNKNDYLEYEILKEFNYNLLDNSIKFINNLENIINEIKYVDSETKQELDDIKSKLEYCMQESYNIEELYNAKKSIKISHIEYYIKNLMYNINEFYNSNKIKNKYDSYSFVKYFKNKTAGKYKKKIITKKHKILDFLNYKTNIKKQMFNMLNKLTVLIQSNNDYENFNGKIKEFISKIQPFESFLNETDVIGPNHRSKYQEVVNGLRYITILIKHNISEASISDKYNQKEQKNDVFRRNMLNKKENNLNLINNDSNENSYEQEVLDLLLKTFEQISDKFLKSYETVVRRKSYNLMYLNIMELNNDIKLKDKIYDHKNDNFDNLTDKNLQEEEFDSIFLINKLHSDEHNIDESKNESLWDEMSFKNETLNNNNKKKEKEKFCFLELEEEIELKRKMDFGFIDE